MLFIFPKLSKQFPFPPLLPPQHAPSRRRLLHHRLLPLLMAEPSPASGDAVLAPAASDAPEVALPAAPADLDKEFGFQREELYKEKLAGTVGFHERHVFLCYKGPEEWPSHLEAESDSLPRLLAAAIKARKPTLKKSTKLTICEGEVGTESSLGDVLIFPDMIRYRGLTHVDVDTFVEEVLVKDTEWLAGSPEAIEGSYVFVCSHGSRDKRCGVCGPVLIARFKEEIEGHGLDGKVAVSACSHVGGHKYAGNVIIFSSDAKGEVTGHWYGYVVPDDVPDLLLKHIGQGEIVDRLWRGQLGLSEEQQKEALELRHAKETPEANGTNGAPAGGCCQVNGSRSNCCRSDEPEEKQDKSIPAEQNHKSSTTEIDKESVAGKKGRMKICQMPTWFETWDMSDTYTTLAVVAAAATVFVAFRCYKTMN